MHRAVVAFTGRPCSERARTGWRVHNPHSNRRSSGMPETLNAETCGKTYVSTLLGQLDMNEIQNWTYPIITTRTGRQHGDPHCPRLRTTTTGQTHPHRHTEQRPGPDRHEIEHWTAGENLCCQPPAHPAIEKIRVAQQHLRHARRLAELTTTVAHIAPNSSEHGATVVDPRQLEAALCYQLPKPTGWHPMAETQLACWLAELRQLEQQHVTAEIAISAYTRAVVEAVTGAIGWEEPDHSYNPHQKWVLGQLARHDPNPHQLCRRILYGWQLLGEPINDTDSRTLDHVTRAALQQRTQVTTVWSRGNRIRYASRSAGDERLGRVWARALDVEIGSSEDRTLVIPALVGTCLGIRNSTPTRAGLGTAHSS